MSYVWTADQVKRYFDYYPGIATRNTFAYLTFETTREFARSVLPPCLEVADSPQVTISASSFMEVVEGYPNRHGRDRVGMIHINARAGDREGVYYLTVIETEEVNVETGRELWGMPKKLGSIDLFDDGKRLWAFVERKGHRLIELEAELGAERGEQPAEMEYYFELRGHFAPNGSSLGNVELVIFETHSVINRFREMTDPHLALTGSPVDPGIGTIPVGDFVSGGFMGGETSYSIAEVVPLDDDGHAYAPYLLGRLYDDWPDVRDRVNRRPAPTRVERNPS